MLEQTGQDMHDLTIYNDMVTSLMTSLIILEDTRFFYKKNIFKKMSLKNP